MNEVTSFGLNFNNFDPNNIQTSEVINCVLVIDKSGSVDSYVDELNNGLNGMIHELQRCHVSDQIMVSTIEFNGRIDVKHGFMPITEVKDFNVVPGGTTNLYGAVLAGIENAENYRKQLELTGISVKTLVFVITDGLEYPEGQVDPQLVKDKINEIYRDEANSYNFTIIMFGVGDEVEFTIAKDKMGIKHLATVKDTPQSIRKMIGFISSSVSSSSAGAPVVVPTF